MDRTVYHPWGSADSQSLAAGTTITAIIKNTTTIITIASLTANATLNLTIPASLPVGATLLLRWATAGSQTLTFGTGITSAVVTGVAGRSRTQGFMYDGTAYRPLGASVQID